MGEMKKYVVERSGDRKVSFTGEIMCSTSSKTGVGASKVRYHEITLYRHETSGFVLHIHYHSNWKKEKSVSEVNLIKTQEEVYSYLKDYDPLMYWSGLPKGKQFEKKEKMIRDDVAFNFKCSITDIFNALEEIEPEVI